MGYIDVQVVLTPLFVFRSSLPAPLLLSVETRRLKTHRSFELPGRGALTQLHALAADMTHNVTFQLRYLLAFIPF